jgi:hypothetical protein
VYIQYAMFEPWFHTSTGPRLDTAKCVTRYNLTYTVLCLAVVLDAREDERVPNLSARILGASSPRDEDCPEPPAMGNPKSRGDEAESPSDKYRAPITLYLIDVFKN